MWLVCASHSETRASASSLHDTALNHLRSRQLSQAEALLEKLRAAHSDTVYPELLQGHLALLSRGDAGAAEALYRRCADLRTRPPSERAAVHHSLARLCRMGERWEEASSLYEAAAALEPSGELEQERLFAAGKLALLRDAPDAAIAPLTAGLGCAQPEWRATFAASSATRAGCAATSTPPPPTTRTRRCRIGARRLLRRARRPPRGGAPAVAAARCAPPPPPSSARARRRRRRRRRPPTRSCACARAPRAWRRSARSMAAAPPRCSSAPSGRRRARRRTPRRSRSTRRARRRTRASAARCSACRGWATLARRSPPAPSGPTRRRRRCAPRSR